MQKILREHLSAMLFVAIIFSGIYFLFFERPTGPAAEPQFGELTIRIAESGLITTADHLDRKLLNEVLDIYYPENAEANDSLITDVLRYEDFLVTQAAGGAAPDAVSPATLLRMYVQFAVIYLLVLVLTYYGVQTLAIYRFFKVQQGRQTYLGLLWTEILTVIRRHGHAGRRRAAHIAALTGRAMIKGMLLLVLFSPAYVIAYSFKTRFDTDSVLFMIILGVISNGLLITYSNKFFTLLRTEYRKGYIETAIVKNLNNDFSWGAGSGIRLKDILSPFKRFKGHILHHAYINADHQYLQTVREQASFVISGLMIIEMALNIHGHLSYELMQNILYKNYEAVLLILFGIFVLIKLTEIVIDMIQLRKERRFQISGQPDPGM